MPLLPLLIQTVMALGVSTLLAFSPQDVDATFTLDEKQDQPATQPAMDEPIPVATVTPEVDALLRKLEAGGEGLQGFKADLTLTKVSALLGSKETRQGEAIYKLGGAEEPSRFALLFNTIIVDGVRRDRMKHFVFDGRWLTEIDQEHKQWISRELGREIDPFRLGEGPFPMPIGQKRDDVLRRFEIEKITLPETGLLKSLENVDGLQLIPRPTSPEAGEYELFDIFYDKDTSLPVGIRVVELNGDEQIVRLKNAVRDPKFAPADLAKLSVEEPDATEWRIDKRPYSAAGR